PHRLQQIHNQYAAKLLKEKQEAERKAYEEQQAKQLKEQFKAETELHYLDSFNILLSQQKGRLEKMFNETTLKDYDFKKQSIAHFPTTFNVNNWYDTIGMYFTIDTHIPSAEQKQINLIARETFVSRFMDTYTSEITTLCDSLIEKMPGKYDELKELEKLSQEERRKAEAEIAERERLKKEQEEAERKQKEETEKARQQAEQQAKQAADLFAAAATAARPEAYAPKVKVSKKIQLTSPDGILPVIMMWWSHEGKDLSTDELQKIFKRQITFCEKIAGKDNILIESSSVTYIDEIKAK
ncbi:MAG: hypothetical protein LUC23_07270, partial [Prevotellaceae bacterium]|nr:hypothetical protein [Prevotellaceae bacterium]